MLYLTCKSCSSLTEVLGSAEKPHHVHHGSRTSTKIASQSPPGQFFTGPNLSSAKASKRAGGDGGGCCCCCSCSCSRCCCSFATWNRELWTKWDHIFLRFFWVKWEEIHVSHPDLFMENQEHLKCITLCWHQVRRKKGSRIPNASRSLPSPAPRSMKRHLGWVLPLDFQKLWFLSDSSLSISQLLVDRLQCWLSIWQWHGLGQLQTGNGLGPFWNVTTFMCSTDLSQRSAKSTN